MTQIQNLTTELQAVCEEMNWAVRGIEKAITNDVIDMKVLDNYFEADNTSIRLIQKNDSNNPYDVEVSVYDKHDMSFRIYKNKNNILYVDWATYEEDYMGYLVNNYCFSFRDGKVSRCDIKIGWKKGNI